MDATHIDEPTGGYTCPSCSEQGERKTLERGAVALAMTEGGDVGVWRHDDPDGRSARATGDTIEEALKAYALTIDSPDSEGDEPAPTQTGGEQQ
jgi:hypothetical protein